MQDFAPVKRIFPPSRDVRPALSCFAHSGVHKPGLPASQDWEPGIEVGLKYWSLPPPGPEGDSWFRSGGVWAADDVSLAL